MSIYETIRRSVILAAALSVILLAGCFGGRKGNLVEDPSGRFSYRASHELTLVEKDGSFTHYRNSEPDLDAYVVDAEGAIESAAVANAFAIAGIDYSRLKSDGLTGFGHWRLERFVPEDGVWYAVAYRYRGGTAYAYIVSGGSNADPDSLPGPVFGILTSYSFAEAAGEVFVPASFGELEKHVDAVTAQMGGSVSIAAMKDGQIIYEYTGGAINPSTASSTDTAHHWGSITKPVTAVAIMTLVDQGLVDLDAYVDTYLPEFQVGSEMTVRNLLGHTSGLVEDRNSNYLCAFGGSDMPTLQEVWANYWPTVTTLEYLPGTSVIYTNFNYLVLGVLFERVSGKELTEYIQQEIFDPLEMDATAHRSNRLPEGMLEAQPVVPRDRLDSLLRQMEYGDHDPAAVVAAETDKMVYLDTLDILPCWGGVKGTAADATRFGQMFVDKGMGPGGRVLESSSTRDMMKAQKSLDGDTQSFGLGWKVGPGGRNGYIEHTGGGWGIDSQLRIYPKQGITIAVLGSVVGYGSGPILEYTYNLVK